MSDRRTSDGPFYVKPGTALAVVSVVLAAMLAGISWGVYAFNHP